MKKKGLAIVFLFVTISAFGQVEYEPGYFIDNKDKKTECLIKNNDWKDNPDGFKYTLSEGSDPVKAAINDVKEFCITGYGKFIRADVQIDRSGSDPNELKYDRNIDWIHERLFLKVLVEGDANLYYYEEGNLKRFFFSVNDSVPIQLIYKKYLSPTENIFVFNGFHQQLEMYVSNSGTSIKDIQYVDYNEKELVEYFTNYNHPDSALSSDYESKANKGYFNFRATGSIVRSTLFMSGDGSSDYDCRFDPKVSYRIGFQAEYILGFNRNKWGLLVETDFQHYKSKGDKSEINYPMIEFPVGIRHYFFLAGDKKLFLNCFIIPSGSVNFNSQLYYKEMLGFEVRTNYSGAIGGGLEYKRLSGEIRYYLNREILSNYVGWQSDFSRIAFSIAYDLF